MNFPQDRLPPQLQHLLPQQLQDLKAQPGFQNMLQNYQRQMQNKRPASQNLMRAPQGPLPGQPQPGPPAVSHMTLSHPYKRRIALQQQMQQMQQKRAPKFVRPAPRTRPEGRLADGPLLRTTEPVPSPPVLPNEEPTVPSGFAPNAPQRLHLRSLPSTTHWLETLAEQGEPVPPELRLFEEVLERDSQHTVLAQKQGEKRKRLHESMAQDIKTYNGIKQLRMNAISASSKNQYSNSIWGEGYLGYGNGVSNTQTQVVLPHQNKSYSKVPDVSLTTRQINAMVPSKRQLVPVRLDFDQEKDRFKLRDTFLWDLRDPTYPLENFVRTLLEDYKFISEQHFHTVLTAVTEQIKDFKVPEAATGELRMPIKIDLVINNTQFTDQFEWDILNYRELDPEEFATVLCDEMCLSGEFATTIAFSIREQTQMYHKALFLVGYAFDGSPVREDEIKNGLLPSLRVSTAAGDDFVTTLRNPAMVSEFSPEVNRLAQSELEKIDKEMERELRRRRRHFASESEGSRSRRGALQNRSKTALPDLAETPRNFRTPVPLLVLPGGIDLGVPDIYCYNELIVNRSQVKNPHYRPPGNMVACYRDSTGTSFFVRITLPRR